MRKNFGPRPFLSGTPTILAPAPRFQPSRPLNIEIYGPKLVWYTKFMLEPHPHCAIELYSGTLLLNQAIRDIGPNSGTVPDIPGRLATILQDSVIIIILAEDVKYLLAGKRW